MKEAKITESASAAEARAEAAEKEVDALTAAAHMPDDYPYGLPSWINQRLYRTYIEQGKDQDYWDALKHALDARDKAEADAARLRNVLTDIRSLITEGQLKTACGVIEAALRPDEQPAESEV